MKENVLLFGDCYLMAKNSFFDGFQGELTRRG